MFKAGFTVFDIVLPTPPYVKEPTPDLEGGGGYFSRLPLHRELIRLIPHHSTELFVTAGNQ